VIKFFIIVGIVAYVIYKIGSFFFRAGAASQHFRQFQEQQRKGFNAGNGSAPKQKATKDSKFKGGEYIDYEEVK
jgi:hypothetical protein